MLGAIAAYLLRMKRFEPDWDRLVTETHWQGSSGRWYEHYTPMNNYYGHHVAKPIGEEVFMFLFGLVVTWWGWRNNKAESRLFFLAIGVPFLIYLPLLWLARQHVEGDWTAVPPQLFQQQAETPEYLANEAAWKEAAQQAEYKRLGLNPEGVKIWNKVCILY
jgi:hypothetical protein